MSASQKSKLSSVIPDVWNVVDAFFKRDNILVNHQILIIEQPLILRTETLLASLVVLLKQ